MCPLCCLIIIFFLEFCDLLHLSILSKQYVSHTNEIIILLAFNWGPTQYKISCVNAKKSGSKSDNSFRGFPLESNFIKFLAEELKAPFRHYDSAEEIRLPDCFHHRARNALGGLFSRYPAWVVYVLLLLTKHILLREAKQETRQVSTLSHKWTKNPAI